MEIFHSKMKAIISAFIKNGANSAVVEVKVKNSSLRAYKHEVYGNYITIVRNINASGGSSYKVKSATGTVLAFVVYGYYFRIIDKF